MKKLLFDCGANNGCSVRKFATDVLPDFSSYEVHCFEPGVVTKDEEWVKTLQQYSNVKLHKKAISTNNGKIAFFDHLGYSAASTTWELKARDERFYYKEDKIRSGDCGSFVKGEVVESSVECVDISEFINNYLESDPDTYIILKMDVEGEEFRVVPKLLKDNIFKRIDVFYIEWHPDWNNTMNSTASLIKKIENQNPNTEIKTWNALGY